VLLLLLFAVQVQAQNRAPLPEAPPVASSAPAVPTPAHAAAFAPARAQSTLADLAARGLVLRAGMRVGVLHPATPPSNPGLPTPARGVTVGMHF
jgi:hypothetical protein